MGIYRNTSAASERLLKAVWEVPPRAADDVARLFRAVADELEYIGERDQARQDRTATITAHIAALQDIPKLVHRQTMAGSPIRQAQQEIAEELDVPIETVQLYWHRHIKARAKADKAFRNRQIAHMLQGGKTNKEISHAVGASVRTVQRVVSDWKAGWLNA